MINMNECCVVVGIQMYLLLDIMKYVALSLKRANTFMLLSKPSSGIFQTN